MSTVASASRRILSRRILSVLAATSLVLGGTLLGTGSASASGVDVLSSVETSSVASADGIDTVVVIATVMGPDQADPGVSVTVPGIRVSFAVPSPVLASSTECVTDADGVCGIRVRSSVPGSYSIASTAGSNPVPDGSTDAVFVGGFSAAQSSLAMTTGVRSADGSASHRAAVTVADSLQNPLPGVTVDFTATSGAQLSSSTAVSGPDGVASVTLTSTSAGSYDVSAASGGHPVSSSPQTVVFAAGNPPTIGTHTGIFFPDASQVYGLPHSVAITLDADSDPADLGDWVDEYLDGTYYATAPVFAANGFGSARGGGIKLPADLAPGGHTVEARYAGSAVHLPSSDSSQITIVASTTTTAATTAAIPASTATATVSTASWAGGAIPTGSVQFLWGTRVLATAPLNHGVATITLPGDVDDSQPLTARYLGEAVYGASTSAGVAVPADAAGTSDGTDTDAELAATGTDVSAIPVGIGLLLLLAGLVLTVTRRRRLSWNRERRPPAVPRS